MSHLKFRVNIFPQDKTRYYYWERTSFNYREWLILKNYCKKKKIDFLSSPFSLESFYLLKKLKPKYWKISSGEINNFPLIDEVTKIRKPIFLSTGMSDSREISNLIKIIKKYRSKIVLLQCTSPYPCPVENVGLNQIHELKKKFKNLEVGFSDHTNDFIASVAEVAFRASTIEKHLI